MVNQLRRLFLLLVFSGAFVLSGCTTASGSFEPVSGVANQYTFKVYTGGFSSSGTADAKAKTQIQQFMAEHGYKSYRVLKRSDHFVPSYFEYTVVFSKTNSLANGV